MSKLYILKYSYKVEWNFTKELTVYLSAYSKDRSFSFSFPISKAVDKTRAPRSYISKYKNFLNNILFQTVK